MSTVSNYLSQSLFEPLKTGVKTGMDAIASKALDSESLQYLQIEHVPYLKTQLPKISDSTMLWAATNRDLIGGKVFGAYDYSLQRNSHKTQKEILSDLGKISFLIQTDRIKAYIMKPWSLLDSWANEVSYRQVEEKHIDTEVLNAVIQSNLNESKQTSFNASVNGV